MSWIFDDYEKEKASIEADKRLSAAGKVEKVAKLRADYTEKVRELKQQLRRNAIMAALALRDAQADQEAHLEANKAKLDYARLNYEAQVVKAQIARAKNVSDVWPAWNKVKESGDVHAITAWQQTIDLSGLKVSENLKQGLLDDIAGVSTDRPDPEITKTEGEMLEQLRETEVHAQAADEFLNDGKATARNRVEKSVFAGISFEGTKVKTAFDYADRPGAYSWETRKETLKEVANRLVAEESARAERAAEVGDQYFGVSLDPDLDM